MDTPDEFDAAAIEILGKAGGNLSQDEFQQRLNKPEFDLYAIALKMSDLEDRNLVTSRIRYTVTGDAETLQALSQGSESRDMIAGILRIFREARGEATDRDLTDKLRLTTKEQVMDMTAVLTAMEEIGVVEADARYYLTPLGQQIYNMGHAKPN